MSDLLKKALKTNAKHPDSDEEGEEADKMGTGELPKTLPSSFKPIPSSSLLPFIHNSPGSHPVYMS